MPARSALPLLLAISAAVIRLAAQSLEPAVLPDAAKAIAVAPGAHLKLKFHFLAIGKQSYSCENGAWSNPVPDATLSEPNSGLTVRHSAGPSWSKADGKSTVKGIAATAIHFAAPDGVSIDWLKLDIDRTSRTGDFRDVEVIQRLYTGGGKGPASGCAAKQVFESPYTAHYYFWTSN
jgi:hypothetical protein